MYCKFEVSGVWAAHMCKLIPNSSWQVGAMLQTPIVREGSLATWWPMNCQMRTRSGLEGSRKLPIRSLRKFHLLELEKGDFLL